MKILKSLLRNSVLSSLAAKLIMAKMTDLHGTESGSCYVFGNGSSLKKIKFENFSDLPSIGCNLLCLHTDVSKLNLKYYTFLDPIKSMGKNSEVFLWRLTSFIKGNSNVTFFVSPFDRYRLKYLNVMYLAPISDDWPGNTNLDLKRLLHRSNEPLAGSLRAQILIAIYLGFDRIILVGHDYTLYPTKSGHFYEKDVNEYVDLSEWNRDFFNEVSKIVDVVTLGIESDSKVLLYEEIEIAKRSSNDSDIDIPITTDDFQMLLTLNNDKAIGYRL